MKANELRISNLVSVNGVHYKIYSIHSPMPMKDKNFSGKYYVDLWNNDIVSVLLSDLEPVPITDELLLNHGFNLDYFEENTCYKEFLLHKNGFNFMFILLNGYYEFYLDNVLTELDYFHELQNFILLITGEELELK